MASSNSPNRCLNVEELLEDSNKEGGSTHESGRKAVADYRLRWPKRLFAYTQTIVRLCANANTKNSHDGLLYK